MMPNSAIEVTIKVFAETRDSNSPATIPPITIPAVGIAISAALSPPTAFTMLGRIGRTMVSIMPTMDGPQTMTTMVIMPSSPVGSV